MKNASYAILALFISATTIHSMDLALPQLPTEIVSRILEIHLLCTIPYQNATPPLCNLPPHILPAVRTDLVRFSFIDKNCNIRVNDPQNVCFVVQQLFQRLRTSGGCKEIVEKINIPGSRNYITQSTALFADDLTPEHITTLKKQGADLDYTYSWHNNGIYNYPLYHWINKNHLDNVKQLLELGADVNRHYGEEGGPAAFAQGQGPDMLDLVLSYKPKMLYISHATVYRDDQIVQMLLDAAKENPATLQDKLNIGLNSSLARRSRTKLFLDEGAQPEYVLKRIISSRLTSTINSKISNHAPFFEQLEMLCSYPVTDTTKLQEVRTSVNEVIDLANNILKILDTCVEK